MNKSKRILWVEDDYTTIAAIMLPLEKNGIQVIKVATYLEAKELVEKDRSFNLFLIDLILPYGDGKQGDDTLYGVELIRYIRNSLHLTTPIIVFSVVYDNAVTLELQTLGVEEKLQKGTFSNQDMRDRVEEKLCKDIAPRS